MRRPVSWCSLAVALAAVAACSKPTIPDHDDRPEPQASASRPSATMREAVQTPIDKANAAQDAVDAAAQREREAIEAATGND